MPENNDLRLANGSWSRYLNGTWSNLNSNVQQWLSERYDGTRGSGTSQVLIPFEESESGPVNRQSAVSSLIAELNPSSTAINPQNVTDVLPQPPPPPPSTPQITQWYREFVGADPNDESVKYPPKKFNRVDQDVMQQFLTWGKATGRFSKDDVASGTTATPKGVDIGGQQYFQQPGEDGQFERIPQEKAAPTAPKIETHGGIQFINQDGKLTPIDNVMKKMKENFVVTGDFKEAAAVHAWQTRPSNQEYFDRMLQYVNAPADQLLISAIARGQGLVAPPPEETIQRIGPQPEYLTEAFNMMREQMQMGQPGEEETFESIMHKGALEREAESEQAALAAQKIANDAAVTDLRIRTQQADDNHQSSVINNRITEDNARFDVANKEIDLEGRISSFDISYQKTGEKASDSRDSTSDMSEGISSLDVDPSPTGFQWQDSPFNFDDVSGLSDEQVSSVINENMTDEQYDIADQIFSDQGGMDEAGRYFNSTEELINAINFHIAHRNRLDGGNRPLIGPEGTTFNIEEGRTEMAPTPPSPISDPTVVPSEEDILPIAENLAKDTAAFDSVTDEYGEQFTSGESVVSLDDGSLKVYDQDSGTYESKPALPMPVATGDGRRLRPDPVPVPSPLPMPVATGDGRRVRPEASTLPAGWGTEPKDPETMAGRWYDEGANGIRTGAKPTLVGEAGPELALFPNGTEIVPLDRQVSPSQARRLRRRGIRGMQEGGIVFGPDQYRERGGDAGVRSLPGYQGTDKFITSDTLSGLQSGKLLQDPEDLSRIYDPNVAPIAPKLPRKTVSSVYDNPLPLGIQKLQAGRSLGAPRGQLLRTAGIALPSAQARRRMLPSEREAFQGLGRMAGIPEGEFQQELGITTPSGARRTGSARMLPLSLRR